MSQTLMIIWSSLMIIWSNINKYISTAVTKKYVKSKQTVTYIEVFQQSAEKVLIDL